MRAWVLAVLCFGCYSPPSYQHCQLTCDPAAQNACPSGLACGGDGRCYAPASGPCDGTDAAPPADDLAPGCFGVDVPPFVRICPSNLVESSSITLTGSLSTDTCPNDDPAHADLCVIAASKIEIMGTLDVHGSRPLVIVGTQTVDVLGGATVDAAGHNGDSLARSPRPNANVCTAESGLGVAGMEGAAGGAGGVLGGAAGDGGGASIAGAAAATFTTPTNLRGGCRGGDGGSSGVGMGGRGGNAGGALYLLAGTVRIAGTINASGGGGRRASSLGGGAGGGAGGMILLWGRTAPAIADTALILALGGGGSTGGGDGSAGALGADPLSVAGAGPTFVGSGIGDGGAGGGYMTMPGQSGRDGGQTTGGGGGGGGSIGVIKSIPPITASGLAIAPDPAN